VHQGKPTDASSPSYISARPEYRGAKVNPIEGIIPLLENKKLALDWIVCAGDIGDKSDAVSAAIAWRHLEDVRKRLHARRLIGNVGNHDVDSRREMQHEQPDQALKALTPPFPIGDNKLCEKFWAHDCVVWKDRRANATLALVNSCGLHGVAVGGGHDPEHLRGFVTDNVLGRLSEELPQKLSRFNILLMHHHIRQHPWFPDDVSHAVNGPKLLDILKGTGVPWLVVHGHQHVPNLSYSDASALAPTILSAGSLAARRLYPVQGRTPRNQLYLIDFDVDDPDPKRISALVFAWNWTPGVGWLEANPDSGLPRQTGFGYRDDLRALADKVKQQLGAAPASRLRWEQLLERVPELQYLIRDDLEQVIARLVADSVMVDFDRWSCPSVFERGSG